jgi:hypothetical protein
VVPAKRIVMTVWGGIIINKKFARIPAIRRMKPSKPRGCGVGDSELYFPSSVEGGRHGDV